MTPGKEEEEPSGELAGGANRVQPLGSCAPPARPLVLIVDDDQGIRAAIADLLEDEGFATAEAANGADALNLLAEITTPPVLILLDLMMPVLDGWTFCKLRQGIQLLMEIPVIVVSAGAMSGGHEPLRADGMLAKPFDPDQLAWLTTRMAGRRSFYRQPVRPRG